MKTKYIILITVALIFGSCSDYLEITPKGELIPQTIEDYELILNGSNLTNQIQGSLETASDNMYVNIGTDKISTEANLYFWRLNIDLDAESTSQPVIWQNSYRSIYYANIVIQNIQNAVGGSQSEKDRVQAEALAVRATSYFYLLTAFSNAYNPDVNPQDLGVPLVQATDVTKAIPARSTLKESFDLVISDLIKAVNILPESQPRTWKPTKYGAAGMLSRVYLYIQDFENANKYASIALSSPTSNKILDYVEFESYDDFPDAEQNPERIWLDYTNLSNEYYSHDLSNLYDLENDSRITLFTSINSSGLVSRPRHRRNAGVSYPEMYLTQAEYLARTENYEGAMDIVNMIRANRLPDTVENLVLEAESSTEALQIVLEERRRELAYTGLRWLDMKRLDMDNRMPTVYRYSDNDPNEEVLGTLEPKSPNYTFEIPLKVQALNPNIKTNH